MKVIHEMSILHRDLATRNVLVHSIDADNVSQVWVKVLSLSLFSLSLTLSPFPPLSFSLSLSVFLSLS